jgi:hypothetical protein
MLWYFHSNSPFYARVPYPGINGNGGLRQGLRQECPNRLLRAVNLFFVIRNTQKPGCD